MWPNHGHGGDEGGGGGGGVACCDAAMSAANMMSERVVHRQQNKERETETTRRRQVCLPVVFSIEESLLCTASYYFRLQRYRRRTIVTVCGRTPFFAKKRAGRLLGGFRLATVYYLLDLYHPTTAPVLRVADSSAVCRCSI